MEISESEDEGTSSHDEASAIAQNLQICNWQNRGDNVLSDTNQELTVMLSHGEEFALVGVFDFVVLKGAININGANFSANNHLGQGPAAQRAFMPSTHPISIVRALDDANQVRFMHCNDQPTPFAHISPLFADIWIQHAGGLPCRSFSLVSRN